MFGLLRLSAPFRVPVQRDDREEPARASQSVSQFRRAPPALTTPPSQRTAPLPARGRVARRSSQANASADPQNHRCSRLGDNYFIICYILARVRGWQLACHAPPLFILYTHLSLMFQDPGGDSHGDVTHSLTQDPAVPTTTRLKRDA